MFAGKWLRASIKDTGESCGSSNKVLSRLWTLENPFFTYKLILTEKGHELTLTNIKINHCYILPDKL
jgi:hypothetical protein